MTRKEKIEQLYQHMKDSTSAGTARALAEYTMKIIESWPTEETPPEPVVPPSVEKKSRKGVVTPTPGTEGLEVKK